MRKVFVVAAREYLAAVRTKAFVIGLLVMPLMMGGSILVQVLLKNVRDTKDKHFAVIDRSGQFKTTFEIAIEEYNKKVTDPDSGKQSAPRFVLHFEKPSAPDPESVKKQ